MKPIYLEMNYFGPHEHSVIDFRKLDESPIFLIGGDTGAGKSTIFDAMTFALFNTTTSDRDAREMRSQFAENDQATRVIFYFEQSGKIYKIERTPEQYLAKKNNKEQLTKKPTTANLSVVDDVNGIEIESVATKPVDVAHAISEILNLNADQFKKIILLPQNDFSEFLRSNTNEKEKILKKIFGTQLFTDFTVKLKDHYDRANAKAEAFNNDLISQSSSQIWSDEENETLAKIPNDQLVATLSQFLTIRQDKWANAQATEQASDKAWQTANQKYHDAQDIQKNFDRLAEAEQQYQTDIVEVASDVQTKQQHVTELEWAKPLQEIVRDLEKTQVNHDNTAKEQTAINAKLVDSQAKWNAAKSEIEQLNEHSAEFEAKNKQAQDLSVQITKVQDVEKIRTDLAKLQPQLELINQRLDQQNKAAEELSQNIANKQTELSDFKELPSQKEALMKEQSETTDALSPLANTRDTTAKEVAHLQSRLDRLHDDLKTKTAAKTVAEHEYNTQVQNRQALMIAQLRQELKDGQACPVCGALDHPAADHIAVANEEQLRKSMDEVDQSQKDFAAAEANVKNIETEISEVSDEFDQKQQAAITAQMDLSNQYNQLVISASVDLPQVFDLEAIKQSYQTKLGDIDGQLRTAHQLADTIKELEQQQKDAQQLLSQTNSEHDKISTAIQTRSTDLHEKLQNITDPKVTSQKLIQQRLDLTTAYEKFQTELKSAQGAVHANELVYSNNKTKLSDNQKQLDQQATTIKDLSEKLTQALQSESAQTTDRDVLDQWITELNQNRLSDLKDTITSYNKEKEILTETIQKIKLSLEGAKKPDLITLKATSDETKKQHDISVHEAAMSEGQFKTAQEILESVKTIMRKQGDFAKELAAITSLYNVVNGKDGNDSKLKLETYVVQNYLQKILVYANNTFLNQLSHNRYSFIISSEGADKKRDHGLDINIYDRQTNATRPSNTLSGGETFIAALSIALSLSEVVQSSANGVQIDALFVDEGFGSLDDETLKAAMDALEAIGKNRMVGVISHIESMRQSIGQQLLVKKIGSGKSEIELINK